MGDMDKVTGWISQMPVNYAESITLRELTGATVGYAVHAGKEKEVTGGGVITGQTKHDAYGATVYYQYPDKTYEFFLANADKLGALLSKMTGIISPSPAVIRRGLTTCWFAIHKKPWSVPDNEYDGGDDLHGIQVSGHRKCTMQQSTFYLPEPLVPHRANLLVYRREGEIYVTCAIRTDSRINGFENVHAHIGSIPTSIRGEGTKLRKIMASLYFELLSTNSIPRLARFRNRTFLPVEDIDGNYDMGTGDSDDESPSTKRRRAQFNSVYGGRNAGVTQAQVFQAQQDYNEIVRQNAILTDKVNRLIAEYGGGVSPFPAAPGNATPVQQVPGNVTPTVGTGQAPDPSAGSSTGQGGSNFFGPKP